MQIILSDKGKSEAFSLCQREGFILFEEIANNLKEIYKE